MNRSGAFLPLSVETIFRSRATITSHAAKEEMLASTLEWQMDPKFENLMNALWDRRINRVTKVIAFGLGSITARTRRREHQKEHALAMSIARSIRSRNPNNPIPIYVQDPDYNDVDKEVLAYFDFQVVEGHGAAGFAMVDPNTFVLAHNANFPVREIIADIVRPAAMYWKPTIPQAQHDENRAFAVHARDVDSVRTRQMMANYNHVPIQGSSLSRYPFYDFYDRCRGPWLRGEVFSNSTLYIRKSLPPPAKTPARRRRRAHSNLVGPGRRRRRNI
ncbi:hypothetical protein F5B19DRAFT_460210 [Rostrohypoxylon terebratum]|nr:hypothetical protein F5B19DRAFT_460210 [Rostrohypoxylon terebratum]